MWGRVSSWRFGALVSVMVVDAVIFAVPALALTLVVAAVASPETLRSAARFLEALADGR